MMPETYRGTDLARLMAEVRLLNGDDAMIVRTRGPAETDGVHYEVVVAPAGAVETLRARITPADPLRLHAPGGGPFVLALVGPSGAGKTTVFQLLLRFYDPTAGRLTVDGTDLREFDPVELRSRIGLVPQEPVVFSTDAWANIRYGRPEASDAEVRAAAEAASAGEFLDALPEGFATFLGEKGVRLSGGQRQRLALATAVVGRPEVVFLDEPTAGIDVGGRQIIRQLIRDVSKSGACVLVTTHDLEEAEMSADRVIIIDHGRVAASGTPAELMRSADHEEIRFRAPPGIDVAALGKTLMAAVEEARPGDYRVEAPPTPSNVATITAWLAEHDLPLADLRAGRQRLEDVFLRLTEITGEMPAIRFDRKVEDAGRRRRPRRSP
jgi:ABC-type multidrug transport system ATPase subunit